MHGEDRMGDRRCSPEDIEVYQWGDVAVAEWDSDVHGGGTERVRLRLHGGEHSRPVWVGSAPPRLINPRVFRRLHYDDCLVNDGAPLAAGESLSFQYANTFRYPLQVSSVSCS
ncbi:hypothetical protein DsansV1_C24g0184301 [Dioscorea sansibarensis]